MADLRCTRCQRGSAPALDEIPFPGELGRQIAEAICADCWHEWQQAEVMVINELRLNFMDPRSQEILTQHMREFLGLTAGNAE